MDSGQQILSNASNVMRIIRGPSEYLARNTTVSPVTLFYRWPAPGRLLLFTLLSIFGSLFNGAYITAFFIEPSLRKTGNVFLALLGVSDICVSGVVMTTSAVVLLSGEGDNVQTCHFQQFIVTNSILCHLFLYVLIAFENYLKASGADEAKGVMTSMRVGLLTAMVVATSLGFAAAGTFYDLDYDYCERKHSGNFFYRTGTTVGLIVIPCIVIISYFIMAGIRICRRAHSSQYRRSLQYDSDMSHWKLNFFNFAVFLGSWAGYFITIHTKPNINAESFYISSWIGVLRSIYSSLIYSFCNDSFRKAFARCFNYCCCKSSVSNKCTSRHRRAVEYRNKPSDVRVHIMHQGVNAGSPQRPAFKERVTQEL